MGTNTSDVEVTPERDGPKVMTWEGNAQASCPLVDVILLTGMNEQVPVTHINLPILGYDPESLRGSHIRTQDTGIQENSTIPQLDGLYLSQLETEEGYWRILELNKNTPKRVPIFKGLLCHAEGKYPRDSSDDNRSYRD